MNNKKGYNYQNSTDIFFKSVSETGTYAGRLSVHSDIETILNAYKNARDKDAIVVVEQGLSD